MKLSDVAQGYHRLFQHSEDTHLYSMLIEGEDKEAVATSPEINIV